MLHLEQACATVRLKHQPKLDSSGKHLKVEDEQRTDSVSGMRLSITQLFFRHTCDIHIVVVRMYPTPRTTLRMVIAIGNGNGPA